MKTAEEIYRSMLAVYEEKTGFAMHDASDLAVRLYAAAAEAGTAAAENSEKEAES